MAGNEGHGSKTTLFILPQKFQKKRLEDIKKSMTKKNITFLEKLESCVTHIVTEYETLEQVERQLSKDGLLIPDKADVVSTKWLTECLKNSQIVPVLDIHLVKKSKQPQRIDSDSSKEETDLTEWACQRGAKLDHFNKKLTDALEVLQEHAEIRDGAQDYSRALAFRRASCVLKALPFTVTDPSQLNGLKDIGGHVRRVITDILDNGSSQEVEEILNSQWFLKMKLFTSVFGVGPSTARNWIDRGWNSIDEVKSAGCPSGDWRVIWGLAFHEDLTMPVLRQEADAFTAFVQREAQKILPGVIVTLTGGFRRGKKSGHDVDILLTHPNEGAEVGLLPLLLSILDKKGLILVGKREKSTYRAEILYQDFKLSMRGQLDHFEKWLGICKFPKTFKEPKSQKHVAVSKETVETDLQHNKVSAGKEIGQNEVSDTANKTAREFQASNITNKGTYESLIGATSQENTEKMCEIEHPAIADVTSVKRSLDDSLAETWEPSYKKSKPSKDNWEKPDCIASSPRDWIARRVDLIVCPYSQYYYALVGWTGSKHFNRDARLYAQKVLGLKLTSHGLFDMKKQEPVPAGSEKEVFTHLKLPFFDPSNRNC